MDAVWLYVNRDGIFYAEGKDNNNDGMLETITGYRMDFQGNSPVRMNYIFFLPYKEYYLLDTYFNGFILKNTVTDSEIPLSTASSYVSMACISGEYYMSFISCS